VTWSLGQGLNLEQAIPNSEECRLRSIFGVRSVVVYELRRRNVAAFCSSRPLREIWVRRPPLRGLVDSVAIEGAIGRSHLQLLVQRRRAEASVMAVAIVFRLSAEQLLAA
jgi:hypothetical protein